MKVEHFGKQILIEEQLDIETDILKFVDDFCKRHQIKYFLYYGSLIGAVRHKGFIPWDDDVDICMLRKDYEQFIKEFQKQSGGKYRIICNKTNPKYPFNFAKVFDSRTVLYEKNFLTSYNGIYIDVFPIDNLPDSAFTQKVLLKKLSFLHNLVGIKIRTRMIRHGIIKTLISDLLYLFLKIVPISTLNNMIENTITKYSSQKNAYVGCLAIGTYLKKERFERVVFNDSIDVPFDRITVAIPDRYEDVLRTLYGDYMKLPPVEQRINRHRASCYWQK